jgi:nuclear pore complex protein Nup62
MIVDINSSLSPNAGVSSRAGAASSSELPSLPGANGGTGGDEDPVQQILAILNAHLNSLRWIDDAVKSLRGRIAGLRRGRVE